MSTQRIKQMNELLWSIAGLISQHRNEIGDQVTNFTLLDKAETKLEALTELVNEKQSEPVLFSPPASEKEVIAMLRLARRELVFIHSQLDAIGTELHDESID